MCKVFKYRCIHCNKKSALRNRGEQPITPINGKDTFHHMQLDLIDFSRTPAGPGKKYHYIAHLIDHYSTFHITEALESKSAEEVLHFLRKAFSFLGFPVILHTDNGSEFKNSLVKRYLESQNIKFVHGKPYKPSTQGKVERANWTIQQIITKLVSESKFTKTWYDVLYEATLAVNTTLSASIKKSPYEHIFCTTPINDGNLSGFQNIITKVNKTYVSKVSINPVEETEDKDDNEGYESPEVAELEPDYSYGEQVKRIREDSRLNIQESMKRMKMQHDRLRNILALEIGDVAAIIIPNQYVLSDANKLPAIVLNVEDFQNQKIYTLVYGEYRIENKYYQHELIQLAGKNDYYGAVIKNESPEEYLSKMTSKFNNNELTNIPLQSAYNEYILLMHPIPPYDDYKDNDENMADEKEDGPRTDSDDSNPNINVQPSMPIRMQSVITEKFTSQKKSATIILKDDKCKVCCKQISSNAKFILCHNCGCKMHVKDECMFGIMQVSYRHQLYCTFACFRRQENYEIKIISENTITKKYTIEYKNGNTSQLAIKKVEELAQYAKMVYDWRLNHPNYENENENDNDNGEIEILSSNVNMATNSNDEKVCCVCKEKLSHLNPHNCHGCKL